MNLPGRSKVESIADEAWRALPCLLAERLTDGRFKRFPHIRFLSRQIGQAVMAGNARLIISMPPRHGKSWLTSLWTPVWFLGLSPEQNVILSSYEADFAASWGRHVRNAITEYSSELGIYLTEDSKAADRWNTPEGGGMITAGIGGAITGRGGNLIIVDDPVKNWEQAMSEVYRQKAIDWFDSTLYTRAEPGASIIILMTRWHQRDLAGYLINEHQVPWKEIRLPALAEENDPLGREIGQALCPERFDAAALESIRGALGSQMWNALYQQRPSAQEGNIFKRQWWRFYRALPARFDVLIQSWDMAFKDKSTSDYVVGQLWGKVGANKYLIDQVRARMDFPTTLRMVRSLSAKYPNAHQKLIEDKANGPAVIDSLKNELSGLIAVEPNGGKEARANAVTADIEAGNVHLPDPSIAPWIHDYIEEFANFPNGAHDDQVDATTQALIRLRGAGPAFAPFAGHGSYR
jgi:predicted phage terminase large subunit-like protein